MDLGKITAILQELLDTEQNRASKRDKAIDELLEKLRKKEAKYVAKLPMAKTEKEARKLERQIKVCQAQISKGMAALAGD